MKNILYLVHRIPYPPNKGDKIRSFNILKYLSKKNNIYLATFIDYKEDFIYRNDVEEYCQDSCFVKISPFFSKVKSLIGLIVGQPLTITYYRNAKMKSWIKGLLSSKKIDYVFVFSSSMSQYAFIDELNKVPKLIDFVDMDSGKWQQYAKSKSWPLSLIYRREAKTLKQAEIQYAQAANASFFVSQSEVDLFLKNTQGLNEKVIAVQNGVDFSYFDSKQEFSDPYYGEKKIICFTGAMDYWANVDAVKWFVDEIFPLIIKHHANCKFCIVGSNPSKAVRELEHHKNVLVTGSVEDIRPYIKHARLIVAPIRIAQGIQNKVLEAMAMEKSIVLTPQAAEGIENCSRLDNQISHTAAELANNVVDILDQDEDASMGIEFRRHVRKYFSWDACLGKITDILDKKS